MIRRMIDVEGKSSGIGWKERGADTEDVGCGAGW